MERMIFKTKSLDNLADCSASKVCYERSVLMTYSCSDLLELETFGEHLLVVVLQNTFTCMCSGTLWL